MPIWSDDYLNRVTLEAEIEISKATQSIVDRIALNVVSGTPFYTLPDYVNNVKRVFWKGLRLDPMAQLAYDNWLYKIQNAPSEVITPNGKPDSYYYSTFGENTLALYPSPNEDVAQPIDGNLFGINIPNAVIVEFYKVANGVDFTIPEYIRKRLIKNYVEWKSFQRDGNGQNLKAAQYWRQKYVTSLARAKIIIDRVYTASKKQVSPSIYSRQIPARPVLPWNWQTETVDEDC